MTITETFVDSDGKQRLGVWRICLTCGNKFISRADQAGKYCSQQCAQLGGRNRVTLTCAHCGNDFERVPSKLKSKHGYYFCSRACKDAAQRIGGIDIIQPGHYGVGCTTYRERAFAVYLHNCHDCGWDTEPAILQVHHIDHNRKNPSIENLVILCPTCHKLRHFYKGGSNPPASTKS